MAIVTTDDKHYKAIADAIRIHRGQDDTDTYRPEEMPDAIAGVHNHGYVQGNQEGYDAGYAVGLDDGRPVGRQEEYDRFWDEYQANGKKNNYRNAFNGYGWTEKNFYPKYDIKGNNSGHETFKHFNCYGGTTKIDLSQRLKDCGVVYDSSGSQYFESTFYYAYVSVIPEVSTIGCKGTLSQVFCGEHIETIEKLILRDDGVQKYSNTFNGATALKNITIEGTIGNNGFNVSWSPLTHDSLMSIINALQDKSADTSGTSWAVTLGTTNLAKLTDAEKAIATQKGWTLA